MGGAVLVKLEEEPGRRTGREGFASPSGGTERTPAPSPPVAVTTWTRDRATTAPGEVHDYSEVGGPTYLARPAPKTHTQKRGAAEKQRSTAVRER